MGKMTTNTPDKSKDEIWKEIEDLSRVSTKKIMAQDLFPKKQIVPNRS